MFEWLSGLFLVVLHQQQRKQYVTEQVHEPENFSALLTRNPKVDLVFWRVWFWNIPWQRETVTPASLLQSSNLHSVFDGYSNTKAHSESVYEAQVTL